MEPKISIFKLELKQRKETERIIALNKNKLDFHNSKWNNIDI